MQCIKHISKMPILELLTPSLNSDAASQIAFRAQWPALCKTIVSAPGASHVRYGYMITENEINVEHELKLVLSLNWTNMPAFQSFVTSDTFKALSGTVKPHALAPPEIQLYKSPTEGLHISSQGFTEVFRTKVPNDKLEVEVGGAWKRFMDAINEKHDIESLHGLSLNLPEKVFVGAIGWRSLEDREAANNDDALARSKKEVQGFADTNSFLVKLSPA
ncbi:hypothetical protein B0O99DRAFT_619996 [Bisporella sp. PMI_857]|nr:hypothetical protein B0O99DRAFT_619996 [Bisporella sp. PMI_857]